MLNSREGGIVLEPEVTKLKLINRVWEVWSARSPPPAADALPSSPTLPGKQSFAESPTACYKLSRYLMEAVWEWPIRTFPPELELSLKLCVKKRIHRRSVAALEEQPSVDLIYKSDFLVLLYGLLGWGLCGCFCCAALVCQVRGN